METLHKRNHWQHTKFNRLYLTCNRNWIRLLKQNIPNTSIYTKYFNPITTGCMSDNCNYYYNLWVIKRRLREEMSTSDQVKNGENMSATVQHNIQIRYNKNQWCHETVSSKSLSLSYMSL